MKTVAYYISDYGYGHASRSIAVIRRLLKDPDISIIVCHSFALSFIKESIHSNFVCYRSVKTDVGYVLEKDSIYPDMGRLFEKYKTFISEWNFRIKEEREFLKNYNVDLVISDISPLPFEAAESLNMPSIGISNFTWYTAYKGLIEDRLLKTFQNAYQRMTYFYSLAGCQEKWNVETNQYGFFSRDLDKKEVNRIKRLVNPDRNSKVIFLGLGMKIDVGSLEQLSIWDSPNCVFIVSSNVQVNRSNVYKVPADYLESQNYIGASDLVISKAGWGMVGEAVNAQIPLLILNRPALNEDQNTINYLKQNQLCETVDWGNFKTYQVDLPKIDVMKRIIQEKSTSNHDQADKIASDILKVINN